MKILKIKILLKEMINDNDFINSQEGENTSQDDKI